MRNWLTSLLSTNSRKDFKTFISRSVALLEDHTNGTPISHGAALHCHFLKTGVASQKYIAVKLLIMYLNARKSIEIDRMLTEFDGFNLVVHNCLIKAKLQSGEAIDACRLFDEMPERNEVSWTTLISGLLRLGHVDRAMLYFERNPSLDVFSWTATINGLVQNELSFQGMELFKKMIRSGVSPNPVTFTSVIRACVELEDFELGKSVLGFVVKTGFEENLFVANSLVNLLLHFSEVDSARRMFYEMEERDVVSWTTYIKMGDLTEARRIFAEMPERNEVTWSAMIVRFTQNGDVQEATRLFKEMVQLGFKPNESCYSSVISALASLEALHAGKNVHAHVSKVGMDRNVFVGSALIDLYSKCGRTKDGRMVFDSLQIRNIVCWNSMISGYSLNGKLAEAMKLFNQAPQRDTIQWNSLIAGYLVMENFDEALELFRSLILSGEQPNKSTFSSVFSACASLASLEKGKYAHAKALKLGFQHDIFVGTALIDMYAKSGSIECSRKISTRMEGKNEIVVTAMIQGLAENGLAEETLHLFDEIARTSSVPLNELIFLSVLFVCSHRGLVDKGLDYFNSMERVYGIKPNERHYTCMVDMLSRSGRLHEAKEFMRNMQIEPEANAWTALLSGCKTHGDGALAARAAEKLRKLVETKSEGYVLVSNVDAWRGRWSEALATRRVMREKGIKKSGGCSRIEVGNLVHQFYSQDETHCKSADIYWVLNVLNSQIHSTFA